MQYNGSSQSTIAALFAIKELATRKLRDNG